MHREKNLITVQKDATVFSLLYFCMQLYTFRLLTPIIKSWYSCNYSFCYWSTGSTAVCSGCSVGTLESSNWTTRRDGSKKVIVKWSRYRPGLAQRVGRVIALLFHDRGTRREWVVSSTPQPHFTPRKDPVPIVQEAGWAQGPVETGGISRPHRDSIPDRPARRSVAIPTELPGP